MGIGNGGRDFVIGRCLISCVIIIGMVSTPGVAQMQPGSTGGTIGKVDKSISGGGDVEQPNSTASRRSLSKSENRSSETSASGRWRWHAGCWNLVDKWHGVFQISQTADGSFTGTFTSDASDSGAAANPVPQQIQSGRVSGGQISFTRVIAPAQQWTGTISPASGRDAGHDGINCSAWPKHFAAGQPQVKTLPRVVRFAPIAAYAARIRIREAAPPRVQSPHRAHIRVSV